MDQQSEQQQMMAAMQRDAEERAQRRKERESKAEELKTMLVACVRGTLIYPFFFSNSMYLITCT